MSKRIEDMTHWKQLFNYDYLGFHSLEDEESHLIRTISKIDRKIVKGNGGKEDVCVIMEFLKSKPMILNKTNSRRMSKHTGSTNHNDWIGKTIKLVAEWDRSFAGGKDWALRIDSSYKHKVNKAAPKKAEKKPISADMFAKAMKAVKAGTHKAEPIKSGYALTKEQITELDKAATNE